MGLQPQKCIRGGKRGLAVNTSYVTPRPLDLFPNAALALGLNALSAATLTSPIPKVRRSSDNAQADAVADLSDPFASITDNSGITVTSGSSSQTALGAFVREGSATANGLLPTWFEQSGNGRDVGQSTAGDQPALYESGNLVTLGGRPALQFGGTRRLTRNAVTQLLGDVSHTIYAVFSSPSNVVQVLFSNRQASTSARYTINIGGGSFRARMYDAANNEIDFRLGSGYATNTDYVFVAVYAAGIGFTLYANGQNITGGKTGPEAGAPAGTFLLGGRTSTNEPWLGKVGTILAYPAAHDNATRQGIERALATYYGVTLA